MAGVTTTGFVKKTLAEVIAEIQTEVHDEVDAKLLVTSDSISGQGLLLQAAKLAELWDVAEAVYNGSNRATALDDALDGAGELVGVPRVGDSASTGVERFTGVAGTLVPKGSLVSDPLDPGTKWRTLAPATIGVGQTFVDTDVLCTVIGPTRAIAGALSRLNTPIVGISGVTNPADANVGRFKMSNEEYLLLQYASAGKLGSRAVAAIKANLRTISGVTFVTVIENETTSVVDGVPAHGMEIIVDGGSNADVAATIFLYKGFSTPLSGNTSVVVSDEDGGSHTVRFTRPVGKLVDVYITLTRVDRSKYPGNAAAQALMANAINKLVPNEPLVFTELYVPAYAIPGTQKLSLKVDTGSGQNENDVVPGVREKVETTADRIHIVG